MPVPTSTTVSQVSIRASNPRSNEIEGQRAGRDEEDEDPDRPVIEPVVELVARPELPLGIELDAQRRSSRVATRSMRIHFRHRTRCDRCDACDRCDRCGAVHGCGRCARRAGRAAARALRRRQPPCAARSRRRRRRTIRRRKRSRNSRPTAARIVSETGVPGAGLALVRADGIEWAGGVGLADRERGIPVTGDTHFRVGSISKTFVAMSLVQLYEEGALDIEAPLEELAPEIAIDNPWHAHRSGAADSPAAAHGRLRRHALQRSLHPRRRARGLARSRCWPAIPRSRRVRWRPGTRMSYSNVGYGVAGLVLEKLTGQPYEDYIQEHIFDPLEMATSSFRLTAEDEALLARGYDGDGAPSAIRASTCGRPATCTRRRAIWDASCRCCSAGAKSAKPTSIDPEYLGNMEQPRTTLAARAGLRNGYGTGIASTLYAALPRARPQRRHRRLPVDLRLLAVTRRRLCRPAQQHRRRAPGGVESPVVAGDSLSQARRRAAGKAGDDASMPPFSIATSATTRTPTHAISSRGRSSGS